MHLSAILSETSAKRAVFLGADVDGEFEEVRRAAGRRAGCLAVGELSAKVFSPEERWCQGRRCAKTGGPRGQVLHGCARTTAAVRRAIQSSQESLIALAERYDINPKTVHKWRKRSFVADAPMGPEPRSTTLSAEQEAMIVALRKHTLLPLDDCLYALQATLPQLTRSSLHRCFQRHGISRLPDLGRPASGQEEVQGVSDRLPSGDSIPCCLIMTSSFLSNRRMDCRSPLIPKIWEKQRTNMIPMT